jgi:hypothetical protein
MSSRTCSAGRGRGHLRVRLGLFDKCGGLANLKVIMLFRATFHRGLHRAGNRIAGK